ncbi:MAG: hypothetical protein AMXMBFR7_49690 [Planctomycetota bacterium]
MRIYHDDQERLAQALRDGDWKAIFKFDRELIPWYCPTCDEMHGDRYWRVRDEFDEDGWHDSIRGTCPRGHERMLED